VKETGRTSEERIDRLVAELDRDAEASGYHLNPDGEFVRSLASGLAVNEERYGYRACPCRLASGDRADDLDIICPCDYRDADVTEWGACYCALYVSTKVKRGKAEAVPVPERRPPEGERRRLRDEAASSTGGELSGGAYPVWRCSVCGYLCAREDPPDACPICKASRDRFTRFS
jgi:ferredoxin-thioredoxin reductase catalytic chain